MIVGSVYTIYTMGELKHRKETIKNTQKENVVANDDARLSFLAICIAITLVIVGSMFF